MSYLKSRVGPLSVGSICTLLLVTQAFAQRDVLREMATNVDRGVNAKSERISILDTGTASRPVINACVPVFREAQGETALQLRFESRSSDASGVGAFVLGSGRYDILLASNRISASELKLHSDKWIELNPSEYLFAGRAVAIVVHPDNPVDTLTLQEVREIFTGGSREWIEFAPSGPDLGSIRRVGVKPHNMAYRLFLRKCLSGHTLGAFDLHVSSSEAIGAVASDPRAIAFVDFAELSGEEVPVKVMAIRSNAQRSRAIVPTPDTLYDGTYPLAQQLHLYLHPNASDTAKRFVEFLDDSLKAEPRNLEFDEALPNRRISKLLREHDLVVLAPAAGKPVIDGNTASAIGEHASRNRTAASRRISDDEKDDKRPTIFDFGRD